MYKKGASWDGPCLEAIEAFGEYLDEKVTTPASSHIFIFYEKSKQLDEEKREMFY